MAQQLKTETATGLWRGGAVGGVCKSTGKMLKGWKNYGPSRADARCQDGPIVTIADGRQNFGDSKSSTAHGR
jgi:hypothetical protein